MGHSDVSSGCPDFLHSGSVLLHVLGSVEEASAEPEWQVWPEKVEGLSSHGGHHCLPQWIVVPRGLGLGLLFPEHPPGIQAATP